jgi:hypothetical protein
MVNQYALAYSNLLNDLIKQKANEEPESTNFLAGIASAREHAIEAEKNRILKINSFFQQQKIAEEKEKKKEIGMEQKQLEAIDEKRNSILKDVDKTYNLSETGTEIQKDMQAVNNFTDIVSENESALEKFTGIVKEYMASDKNSDINKKFKAIFTSIEDNKSKTLFSGGANVNSIVTQLTTIDESFLAKHGMTKEELADGLRAWIQANDVIKSAGTSLLKEYGVKPSQGILGVIMNDKVSLILQEGGIKQLLKIMAQRTADKKNSFQKNVEIAKKQLESNVYNGSNKSILFQEASKEALDDFPIKFENFIGEETQADFDDNRKILDTNISSPEFAEIVKQTIQNNPVYEKVLEEYGEAEAIKAIQEDPSLRHKKRVFQEMKRQKEQQNQTNPTEQQNKLDPIDEGLKQIQNDSSTEPIWNSDSLLKGE